MAINKYIIAGALAAATVAGAQAFTPTRSVTSLPQLRTAAPLPARTVRTVTAPAPEGADVVFSMRPTREEFDACTIIDGNGDGKTFEYQTANASFDWPIVYNNNGAKLDADEWIITPAVTLTDTEHFYQVQIDAMSRSSFNTERFEVKVGKAPTPEAMTIAAISETVECLDWETFTGSFGISDPGTYYIG
ncbi:MAG: hypothetical protein K2M97_04335, partial [Muribaculaceae bacterium]|nr:hypothetical protein [Muribaculaceae bacterium]